MSIIKTVVKLSLLSYIIEMEWSVSFYKTSSGKEVVKEWILTLEDEAKNKIGKAINFLIQFGLLLSAPYSKYLGDKLHELRIKDSKGIYRIIYFANKDKKFVLLHGFVKKDQKTPKKEIDIAKMRMAEVLHE